MKKILYILCCMLLPLSSVSCGRQDAPVVGKKKFAITILNKVPATVHPGDNLDFVFSVKYAGGISSVRALVDGKTLEESVKTFGDTPDSVGVEFSYKVAASYAGNSLDFAVAVEAADGNRGHYDVPVFVLAAQPDVIITLPDDLPSEFRVDGSTLAFDVLFTSDKVEMKSLTTYKNNAVLEDMSYDIEGDPKNHTLHFSYTPRLSDAGAPTVFTFEIMDTNGSFISQNCSITFTKEGSLELNEYTDLRMGLNKCTQYGQFIDAITGTVYSANGVGAVSQSIDFILFWSGNSTTIGAAFASPHTSNIDVIYPEATVVTTLGGTTADIPANWKVRNTTAFRQLTLTADQFAAVNTQAEVEELFNNGDPTSNEFVMFKNVTGSSLAFKVGRNDGTVKYGIIYVKNRAASNNTGYIIIDYKIER